MAARLVELRARRTELRGLIDALLDKAATDKRALKSEEAADADKHEGELELVQATIRHEELRLAGARESGASIASVEGVGELAASNPWGAFDPKDASGKDSTRAGRERFALSFGSFLAAVAAVAKAPAGAKIDPRLLGAPDPQAAASGLSSTVPSDGGFLVRTDFATILLDRVVEASQLLPKTTRIPLSADSDGVEVPYIDETSRANGSRFGGVQVFRRAEAETVAASKPKIGELELRLEDLMGICYATDRSLRDARALGAIIEKSFSSEMAFKIDDEIFRGTGVGQCQGISNSAAYIQQAAEGGQTPATVNALNVQKMFPHMPVRFAADSEWYINADVWAFLFAMNQANMPIFMPGGNIAGAPFGTLMGRKLNEIEQASAIGTVGDISLLALSEYLVIEKGGLEIAESMHVRFLYGEKTFRFTYPIMGKPAWKTSLAPYKGAVTKSPFVGLAAR